MMLRPPHQVGGRGKAKLDATLQPSKTTGFCPLGSHVARLPGLEGSVFISSRARFLTNADISAHHFGPAHYLPFLEAACYIEYIEPRLLENCQQQPSTLPLSKFRAPRKEALEFVQQLDAAGRLVLALPEEAPAGERMNLIAVYKNEAIDRTVWDRRRRNHIEYHIRGAAASLPAGYELCEIEVTPGTKAFLYVDDVADMYPSFVSTRERALTNALAIELTADECRLFRAARKYKGNLPAKLVPCCASLVMGDRNAVDFATGGHEMLLENCGALPPAERVLYGSPPPRGDRYHYLVIDDHIGVAVGKSLKSSDVTEMHAAFSRGTRACAEAKLPQHEAKKVRGEEHGLALGAELIEGRMVGSERMRRAFLSLIFVLVAKVGRGSGAL